MYSACRYGQDGNQKTHKTQKLLNQKQLNAAVRSTPSQRLGDNMINWSKRVSRMKHEAFKLLQTDAEALISDVMNDARFVMLYLGLMWL